MSKYFAYIHNNLFGNEWCKNRTDLSASKRQSSKDKIPSEKMTFFKNNLFRNYNDESTNEEEENPAKRLKLQSDTTIEVQ